MHAKTNSNQNINITPHYMQTPTHVNNIQDVQNVYDICIIGAGIVGCAIARELSRYALKICLLEKNDDVATATTKANSGIVHGGYAEKHGSIKAAFSAAGNRMYPQLAAELHFGFAPIGSFVIGFDEHDAVQIQALYANGIKNGVEHLQIVDGDFVRRKEPQINQNVTIALYCPTTGVTSPYEAAIALAENAIDNGVELRLSKEVVEIKRIATTKNTKQTDYFTILTTQQETQELQKSKGTKECTYAQQETLRSKLIINAAGLYADEIAALVDADTFTITPRHGQYLLFDKNQGELVNSVIFQTPTAISKGILVTRTCHGNLLIGPDAELAPDKNYVDTSSKNIANIIATAQRTLPHFDLRKVITAFAGNRAISSTGDFVIGESEKVPGFINVAGIESPGLTAAPAIAQHIVKIIGATGRVSLQQKASFNPIRRPYHAIAALIEKNPQNSPQSNSGSNLELAKQHQTKIDELNELIKREPCYGCVVCRCETVSEGEIRDALSRSIPINSIDAIKRRTRAGMGRCQGGFCTPRIMEIIEDALHVQREKITTKGGCSLLVQGRTKRALEK